MKLRQRLAAWGLLAGGALALYGSPALADDWHVGREIQLYGGELFGDRLTETPISGVTPRLDDAAIIGLRNTFNLSSMWGVQLSTGFSPGRAAHVASGDSTLNTKSIDLDGVFNLPINDCITAHAELGVGYAWASLKNDIVGFAGANPVDITGSNGYTANVGLGAKYFLTRHLFVDF